MMIAAMIVAVPALLMMDFAEDRADPWWPWGFVALIAFICALPGVLAWASLLFVVIGDG